MDGNGDFQTFPSRKCLESSSNWFFILILGCFRYQAAVKLFEEQNGWRLKMKMMKIGNLYFGIQLRWNNHKYIIIYIPLYPKVYFAKK